MKQLHLMVGPCSLLYIKVTFVILPVDDDTTAEELSTYDTSSEDVVNKSYDSDCSGIGIVQTSEGSANEVSIFGT